MIIRPSAVAVLLLSALSLQANATDTVVVDFEGDTPVAQSYATHKATITAVDDTPKAGGKVAAQTVADADAGTTNHFGTGVRLSQRDFSTADAIRFWIKTDIPGSFNLQIHGGRGSASVYPFSIAGAEIGKWKQVTAAFSALRVPQWADGEADLSRVGQIQVTAYGSGPYDGRQITIDQIETLTGKMASRSPAITSDGPRQRGGPVFPDRKEVATEAKSPPPGFRSLFDGKTLNGWKPMARIPVPKYPGAPFEYRLQGEQLQAAMKNTGRWIIENGAIVGGQEPPGSGKGAYLVSDEKFGDFELMMDMKPDWKTDSGFLVRTLPGGSPGMQILVDHRPQGGIGGFYGNGVAGVHGMPFAIDAKYDAEGNPIGMISANPDAGRVELNQKTREILSYAGDVEDFLAAWNFGQWNTVKVRCEGRIPTLTTWVNGVKVAVLDMNAIEWENYDAEACAKMMGRKGHISLEVHNNRPNDWLSMNRWWPGAVVRWKNIFIRELD